MSLTVERVQLGKLRPYPGNARRGDVDAIAESLRVNGQFRPLVVQRSTGYVLGGNHTLQAAQKLHWSALDVTYLDVDDDAARRIVVADNRTSDLGGYDDRALVQLLREIGEDLDGTGYGLDDYDDLLAALEEQDADAPPQEPTVLMPDGTPRKTEADGTLVPYGEGNVRVTPSFAAYEDAYRAKATRFLALIFPLAQYVWVVDRLAKVAADTGSDSNSEVLVHLLADRFGEVPPAADAEVSAEDLAAAERQAEQAAEEARTT